MKKMKVVSRRTVFKTPWFRLVAKEVAGPRDKRPHFALEAPDYVSVFALAPGRKVVLVRQFRPVIEKYTVEMPSGHVEKGQTPLQAAHAELFEETGYRARRMQLVGSLQTDGGRLNNRTWCFYAEGLTRARDWKRDPEVEPLERPLKGFLKAVRSGRFGSALNLAVVALVVWKKGLQ